MTQILDKAEERVKSIAFLLRPGQDFYRLALHRASKFERERVIFRAIDEPHLAAADLDGDAVEPFNT